MTSLAMGGNTVIAESRFTLDVYLPEKPSIDVTALQLYADGKVQGDGDMCFYNQPSIADGAIVMSATSQGQQFAFNLDNIDARVQKIVVNATLESGAFYSIGTLRLSLSSGIEITPDTAYRTEAALILCEIYRHNSQWKIRHVGQGFNGGLQALAEHFGMDVETPEPSSAPAAVETPSAPPVVVPPISLEKVSLSKSQNKISLEKPDGQFGLISVNLNWNQQATTPGGFLGMKKRSVDLDLGAFVEFKTGDAGVIQALGDCFGELDKMPFTQLMGDDRTGTSADGEWLEINGDAWNAFRRVLIFAFIYEGATDWQHTDGVIRIRVPGQPEIEVRMNELNTGKRDRMCAVALLENDNNNIRVSREIRFFNDHRHMDDAYGWNIKWRAGKK